MRLRMLVGVVVVVALLSGYMAGYLRGGSDAMHLPIYTVHDVWVGGHVASMQVGNTWYGVHDTVPWRDRAGVEHDEGWPECLPSVTTVKTVRFAGAILWHEGMGIATVTWVDCQGQ